jgi:hypothetical protein
LTPFFMISSEVPTCLSPLISWTEFEKQFSNSKFRKDEQNEKKIHAGGSAVPC